MSAAEGIGKALRPCPHLPPLERNLDFRHIEAAGAARGADFYLRCLEYAQKLWLEGAAARSVLAIDRALGADLTGEEAEVRRWPLPYRAMAWVLGSTPDGVFLGNPRVHFQHLSDRVRGDRRELRATRYWACWWLSRAVLPELPGDPRHAVREPSRQEVHARLSRLGIPGEAALWEEVLASCVPSANRARYA